MVGNNLLSLKLKHIESYNKLRKIKLTWPKYANNYYRKHHDFLEKGGEEKIKVKTKKKEVSTRASK